MKIKLKSPFKEKWKFGYLRKSKDGRKRVDLFNSNTDRTTISYARYKVSVKRGVILSSRYEVDHKNGDKTDDSSRNLQVLSRKKHLEKTLKERPKRKISILICPICHKEFQRYTNQIKKNTVPKCSRRCNGKWGLICGSGRKWNP